MRHRRPVLFVLAALLFAAVSAPILAQTDAATTNERLYRLAPDSRFEDGCFDPCMCPVHVTAGLLGTMVLAPGAPDATTGFTVFPVREASWLVPGPGHWVTGMGIYRIGGQPLMHQLTLDLKVGDRDVQRFDSGLVPVPASAGLPEIAITISINNLICNDTVFHLLARPVLQQEIAPYALYRSHYDEGCFGVCDCATTSQPLTGRFGLLKLAETPEGADFAVVGFRGVVHEPEALATDTGWPVSGAGLYQVGLLAREQRLRLALVEKGRGPARFDSGVVPGDGNLKRIDADAAENGFACHDRVYSIHARRRPPTTMTFQVIAPEPVPPVVEPAP